MRPDRGRCPLRRQLGETGLVPLLTQMSFTALARSSPWKWRTLRFVLNKPSLSTADAMVSRRCWLRRPDLLRADCRQGDEPVEIVRAEPAAVSTLTSWRGGGRRPSEEVAVPVLRPGDDDFPVPGFDTDGLVAVRSTTADQWLDFDAPMLSNYHFVAMLDPVELADGMADDPVGDQRPVVIDELVTVDHHGRPAWQAVLTPTAAYRPRCDCCALLYTTLSADRVGFPADALPVSYRVRLDVGTGVCVQTVPLDGDGVAAATLAGHGHQVVIEAVDEDMPDGLFE